MGSMFWCARSLIWDGKINLRTLTTVSVTCQEKLIAAIYRNLLYLGTNVGIKDS